MAKATINGREIGFDAATTILSAARVLGVDVPTLCHDDRVKSCGACRMCIVSVGGRKQPVASCQTPLEDGMEVVTDSAELEAARRMYLKMLADDYPAEAFRRYPQKPFHRLAARYGLTEADFNGGRNGSLVDHSHVYIDVDMSRCIECFRCVRVCDELQGQFVWTVVDRGGGTRIVPDNGAAFGDSSCVSCGACSDSCPTGALEDKSVIGSGSPDTWTKTVCPYCGTGCELDVGTRDDRVVQIKPARETPVSHGHLCVKGRYAYGFVDAGDRVTEPMIRKGGEWHTVSWEEAIGFAADEMRRLIDGHGKESVAVLGSARATNEENYVTQKFVRTVLGTNNVDCCARVCHTPTAAAMKMMLGTGAATNSFADIEMTKSILIVGANPTENHPIPGARIKQAALKGAKLVIVDPRRTELTRYADVHLQLRPGTNIPLLNSIACAVIEEGLADETFIAGRVDEFEEYKAFVAKYSPEAVADICGVEAEDIRRAARIYASEKPAMSFHGLGVTEHLQGTEGVMCVVNLALLTGNIGKRGAGVNPLRGQNNVQGSAHMGCDPGVLTGGISLDDGRERFESVWGLPVPDAKGYNQLQMMDAAFSGKLKALWAIGYDVFLSNANSHKTADSLKNLELVIIQDMFMNETAKRFGTVFFPVCSSFEKDGTFMNAERRIQLLRPAVTPRGSSRTDWEIVCGMANAMGAGRHFAFGSSEEIWDEVRAVWPNAGGITYDRIKVQGLQWNCPTEDHPGTEYLHAESFGLGVKAALRRIEFRPTKEAVSEEYPLLLTTGRTLYQFNAGTMTERTPNIDLRPSDLLEISRTDAKDLGISNGETVLLKSAHGEARIPVHVSDSMNRGELFATFHSPGIFINYVTSPVRDRFVLAPEFKVTAVRVERLC
jgi:formate dehydrogenase major subunit